MTNPRKVDFLAKAEAAWGDTLPAWVAELAREANRTSGAEAARRIGYSPAVLSYIIGNKYPGDVTRVQQKVEGAFLGAKVMCPVYGEIGRDYCLEQQEMDNTMTSAVRGRVYRTCRGIGVPQCPHSHHKPRGA
ncbi:transcriptional regulator [Afipia sp. P52-10]|uniref:hypothetical protein n=1 Tax=Afipia sp. P52-10 TaxID=1429916 RepID=UPI0003DF2102|nr:hypothetical protein [Afipia sp. P52-10]ETR79281.1 transcriptional regulator [Afipia sp. P52-10]